MVTDEHPGNEGNSGTPPGADFPSFSDRELCDEIERMAEREREISFQRRFLHGQIQLARADLARRLTLDTPLAVDRTVIAGIEQLLAGMDRREEQ